MFHSPEQPADQEFDRSLRPTEMAEFVGQERIRENLRIAIAAATERSEPLDHVLLAGPPGLGKTTLAHLIASGMGSQLTVTSGPALSSPKDLMGTLTRLERGDVLFVDEIHRLPRTVEEYLYAAMEDHAIDVVLDQGTASRSIRVTLAPFTLVGATTREGLLTAAFRSRFGLVERLEAYPPGDIRKILERAGQRLGVNLEDAAADLLSERSRGVPRMALRIFRRVRDLAQIEGRQDAGRPTVDPRIAGDALERLGIDPLGLEEMDRRLLRSLIQHGDAVGLKTLAAMVDEADDTIEDVFEPHLIRLGLVARTPRGRVATARAYHHLGLPIPEARGGQDLENEAGQLPFGERA